MSFKTYVPEHRTCENKIVKIRLMLVANFDVLVWGNIYDIELRHCYARNKTQAESSKGAATRRLDHV